MKRRSVLRTGLKWLAIAVGVLVLAAGLITLIGSMLPEDHVAARSLTLDEPAPAVWAVVRDVGSYHRWWPTVDTVTAMPTADGTEAWKVDMGPQGSIPMAVTQSEAPVRLVTTIADTTLPFGGTWTYEIVPLDGGRSRVTVTERGRISSPFFRFMARFVFGYEGTIESYLGALAVRFGAAGAELER